MFFTFNFYVMKILSYEELSIFIQKELAIPDNPRIVNCQSNNSFLPHIFILLEEDITFMRPWQGYFETFHKGDYLNTDIEDIYGINQTSFSSCYQILPRHN